MYTLPTHVYVKTTCKVNFASNDPFKIDTCTRALSIAQEHILYIKYRAHVTVKDYFLLCVQSSSDKSLRESTGNVVQGLLCTQP